MYCCGRAKERLKLQAWSWGNGSRVVPPAFSMACWYSGCLVADQVENLPGLLELVRLVQASRALEGSLPRRVGLPLRSPIELVGSRFCPVVLVHVLPPSGDSGR